MSTIDSSQLPLPELAAALTAARVGSWTLDLATGVLESSGTCKGNFGRRATDPFTYDDLAASIVEDDRAAWRADIEQAITARAPLELEYRVRWPDGSLHWILVRGSCRLDGAGEPTSMTGVTIDVSARKAGEDALARHEDRQRFVAMLNDALRTIDDPELIQATATTILGTHLRVGRVAYFSIEGGDYVITMNYVDGIRPLIGRFPTDALGGRVLARYNLGRPVICGDVAGDPELTPAEREAYLSMDIRAFLGVPVIKAGAVVGGLVIQHAEPRLWSDYDLLLAEETAERTWAAAERARSTRALEESRARFDLVRQAANVGFWFCDLPFDVLVWDERVKEHFWLPPHAVVTIDRFYELLHPDDREPTRAAIAESITGQVPYDVVYRTVSPDGAQKWIRAIGRTYYAESGEPLRFDGVTLDVTAQRQAEDALRANDRRKDEFLAMLAHELRNPLAPIVNATHLLKRPDTGPVVQQRARDVIDRQVQHLTKLVDDLLDVSRITQGKIPLRLESLELSAVLASAVEANRPLIEARCQELTVRTSDPSVRVYGDMTRLVQVVSNLLNNAAKYTDEGGQIGLHVTRDAQDVVIRVVDDGIGISAELLPSIFDLFTQADRSLDRAQGGLGLGLTLVRLLVEMHGGSVEATSAGHGHGTAFTVRLPRLLPVDASAPADIVEPGRADGRPSMRILVVEDNEDSADVLAAVLQLEGHQVEVAYDGVRALETAATFLPQVVVCDIGLPGVDGYGVAAALRDDRRFDGTTLIALSGYGQDEDRRRSAATGFGHHLVKPVDPRAIVGILATLPAAQG